MTTLTPAGHLRPIDLEKAAAGERITAQAHLDGCEACAHEVATLRSAASAFLARQPTAAFLERHRAARPSFWRRSWPVLALAPVAAGLALLIATPTPPPDVRLKGGAFIVQATRDGQPVALSAAERPRAGDVLHFVWSGDRPGHLLVLDLEAGRPPSSLFPFGAEHAAPVPAGRTPLADAVTLDDTAAPEWLVAVFREAPLARADVEVLTAPGAGQPPTVRCDGCAVQLVEVTRAPR